MLGFAVPGLAVRAARTEAGNGIEAVPRPRSLKKSRREKICAFM
jgi:hypothetical protein